MIPIAIFTALLLACIISIYRYRSALLGLLTHTLRISFIELNLWEDDSTSYSAQTNQRRIGKTITCPDAPICPVSPYFRTKPRLLEEWLPEGIALMRVSPNYRSRLDPGATWSVCGNCRFITYHNRVHGFEYQYTQIKAVFFDDKTGRNGTEDLAEKIYKRTGMPSIILWRSISRVHLYINHHMVCLSDNRDLGFDDLVTLLENSAK